MTARTTAAVFLVCTVRSATGGSGEIAVDSNMLMKGVQCGQNVTRYWINVGDVANGYSFYRDAASLTYLYHDLDCNGDGSDYNDEGGPLWIIGPQRPNEIKTSDLDLDKRCSFHTYLHSTADVPPSGRWRSYCTYTTALDGVAIDSRSGWENFDVTFEDIGEETDPNFDFGSAGGNTQTAAPFLLISAATLLGLQSWFD